MLRHIGYFRWKSRRLTPAYREFLARALQPGGTIFISECDRRWPTTRVDDRHVVPACALGGPTVEGYLHGGTRVFEYLARYGSHRRAWEPPKPDGESPEANGGSSRRCATISWNWRASWAVASSACASTIRRI